MKKIIFILPLLVGNYCFSQNVADVVKHKPSGQHSVYLEWLGNAPFLYSIGYDYTFQIKEKHKIAINCGIQYLPVYNEHLFTIIPQISYLYAFNKSHHVELGVGCSYMIPKVGNYEIENNWHLPLRIGYRYQKEDGGFFFKFAYTPAFTTSSSTLFTRPLTDDYSWHFMPMWAGIAFGYTFK